MSKRRLAIIGAGPIGLEAALYGLECGFDVKVYERGPVAANVASWAHVRLFSPWRMNTTTLGLQLLDSHGLDPPDPEEHPTGDDLLHRYLQPIAAAPRLAGRMLTDTRVVLVSRESQRKSSAIGRPEERALTPFRLLVHDGAAARIEHADVVLDCSGTYGNPCGFGLGSMDPLDAPLYRQHIDRVICDVRGFARDRYAGKHVLVVGNGYSAATQIVALQQLAEDAPGTRVTWVTARDRDEPLEPIDDDPLPERRQLTEAANRLALDSMSHVTNVRSAHVSSLRENASKRLNVDLVHGDGSLSTVINVDVIMALVGYRPDLDLDRELQVHRCYATEGIMKLAAHLLGAEGAAGGDCLAVPPGDGETLRNPEPDFYCLGSKSYGRNSNFLLQAGHEQVREVFKLITGDPELDHYTTVVGSKTVTGSGE